MLVPVLLYDAKSYALHSQGVITSLGLWAWGGVRKWGQRSQLSTVSLMGFSTSDFCYFHIVTTDAIHRLVRVLPYCFSRHYITIQDISMITMRKACSSQPSQKQDRYTNFSIKTFFELNYLSNNRILKGFGRVYIHLF